jgi:sec-independent protein translocase protein TatB
MLPSLGFQEILLLAILALVVVGPKDLPLMLRKLGRWTAKLRAMAQEFRTGFDELARQAELDELKKEVEALRRDRTLTEIEQEITRPALVPFESPAALPPPETAQSTDMTTAAPDAGFSSAPESRPADSEDTALGIGAPAKTAGGAA